MTLEFMQKKYNDKRDKAHLRLEILEAKIQDSSLRCAAFRMTDSHSSDFS
jgi:hypothetical protein